MKHNVLLIEYKANQKLINHLNTCLTNDKLSKDKRKKMINFLQALELKDQKLKIMLDEGKK